ncbi:MAG: outer membrane protein transport protein [bacterium]
MRYSSVTLQAFVALGAGVAAASGFDASNIGSAFSGPVCHDPAAVHHNPGLLVHLERPALLASLGIVAGSIGYTRDYRGTYQLADGFELRGPVPEALVDPSKSGPAQAVSATVFSPAGDVFVGGRIHDRLGLGLGVYVPYAAPVGFDADGPQRFQLQEVFIAVTRVTASVGVGLSDKISIGAGVSYLFGLANLKKIQDFGAVQDFSDALAGPPVSQANDFGPDAPPAVRELDVLARPFSLTEATAHALSFVGGVFVQANENVEIGLSYDHGGELEFEGDFALDMSDDFFTQDLASEGLVYAPLVQGDAFLTFRVPKRVAVAVAVDVSDALRLEPGLTWVKWSDVDAFRIRLESPDLAQPKFGLPPRSKAVLPRNWQDSLHAVLPGRYRLTGGPELLWLVGYESPASPDETVDAASPDGHRLLGGFGARFAFSNGMSLLADAKLQATLPREVTTSQNDLANGRYTLFIAAVGAHLTVPLGGGDAR